MSLRTSILILVLGVLVGYLCLLPPPTPTPTPLPDPSLPERAAHGDWKYLDSRHDNDFLLFNETINVSEEGTEVSFNLTYQVAGTVDGLRFFTDTTGNVINGKGEFFSYSGKFTFSGGTISQHTLRLPLQEGAFLKGVTIIGVDEENVVHFNKTIAIRPKDYISLPQEKLDEFSAELKIVIAGGQGVGKVSLINALLNLLFGRDKVVSYTKSKDIRGGAATTKTVTIFDKEWADRHGDKGAQKVEDLKIYFVDSPGYHYNQADHFNEEVWRRIITGQHPNFYDPESNDPLDPSTFNNKTAM